MGAGWLTEHIVEVFGVATGIAYVILEIRRHIYLWPLGIITSAVYIYVFYNSGFYANMGLQLYYLVISIYGWYHWSRQTKKERRPAVTSVAAVAPEPVAAVAPEPVAAVAPEPVAAVAPEPVAKQSDVRRVSRSVALWCASAAIIGWAGLWLLLSSGTDSPVPLWDALIASLSVVATWMLTRKYLEQWYLWIIANAVAVVVYSASGLYPTALLFFVYFTMAIVGLKRWKREVTT